MSIKNWWILTIVAGLLASLAYTSLYVVRVDQFAIVTQFGRVVATKTEPGLQFKIPFVHDVTLIDKRLREWDGNSEDILTNDKLNIEVSTWARWRVTDPQQFYEALRTERAGHSVLDGLVDASVKNVISANTLMEVLRNTDRRLKYKAKELENAEAAKGIKIQVGREKVVSKILGDAQGEGEQSTKQEYGFEIDALAIRHINYVKAVIPKIYERMTSERTRIANRFKSEGREREALILGQVAKDLEKIESEGYAEAQRIRGEADAEVLKIYADAYGQDPEFYSFLRTLDLYPKTLHSGTRMVLSAEKNDFFRYIKRYSKTR